MVEQSGDKKAAMLRCPSCGVHVRQDRLSKHLRKVHSGDEISRHPQKGNRSPLAGKTEKALRNRLVNINRELKGLAVRFSRERIEQLTKEKRMIAAEFERRKAALRQTRWTRWSKGPGSVRQVTGKRSIWARKEDPERRTKKDGQ
jgi:uncharacterized C2H2 Zn-finger protein